MNVRAEQEATRMCMKNGSFAREIILNPELWGPMSEVADKEKRRRCHCLLEMDRKSGTGSVDIKCLKLCRLH